MTSNKKVQTVTKASHPPRFLLGGLRPLALLDRYAGSRLREDDGSHGKLGRKYADGGENGEKFGAHGYFSCEITSSDRLI